MGLPRRKFLRLAAGAAALPALSRVAMAQSYPSRPVTMIVPFPAGGATDVIARIMAERMREPLGQPVIIENIGGADGSIGVGRTARARPDGYTINIGVMSTHVLNAALYSLQYDVLNHFAPIVPLATTPGFATSVNEADMPGRPGRAKNYRPCNRPVPLHRGAV